MKQIALYAVGACLLPNAPLHAESSGAVAGTTGIVVQSEDGSSGSFGSNQSGAISDGSLAIPKVGALEGYLGVDSADLAKSNAGFTRIENRGASAVEGVVEKVTSARPDTGSASSNASSVTTGVQNMLGQVQATSPDRPSGLDLTTPALAGIDLSAGVRALTLQGTTQ